jgi:C-terminal processing protease CtpA/Prc
MRKKITYLALIGLITLLACGTLPSVLADETPQATSTPEPTGESQGVTNPADDEDIPEAAIMNDEGGPVLITGQVAYTYPFFTQGTEQPLVILEDQTGFVHRQRDYVIPVDAQTIGHITSDWKESPFTFDITLPIVPQAPANDVDHDSEDDPGVMIFAIAYWDNVFGDPYLQERDLGGGGWSTDYASTRTSDEYETEREVIGGKLVVYSPDDAEAFPSEFGADGLLFTDDDPLVRLPEGWTVVNLDVSPFTFNRARKQTIDLIESESSALEDFSDQSYADAFTSMVDLFREEYAFTEYKHIEWDALYDEYLPRFEEADSRHDALTYRRALADFLAEIPDGHVNGPIVAEDFYAVYGGGLAMQIAETDNGQVFVTDVIPGGPADDAGIDVGAEIIEVNGELIEDLVDAANPSVFGAHSTEHTARLYQVAFALRFPAGEDVSITFQNPGEAAPTTADVEAVQETDSLFAMLGEGQAQPFNLPVEYQMLPEGYAYVKIYSFFDNKVLTVDLWERLMQTLNEQNVPGLIIDMRNNGGGWGFIADQMAAYFFDERLVLGNSGRYDESLSDFYFDPEDESEFIPPAPELRYHGDIAVLISPDCASACEFFAYDMTIQDRATIIGHYPTAGLGGGVEDIAMPDDVAVRFTISRAVDANENIHIEGIGVQPDVRVPVTEETIFGPGDALLQAAIEALGG